MTLLSVVFAVVGLLVYWPYFDPGQPEAVGRYDVFRQFGPWCYFFDRSLHAGEFPTWNPLSMVGMPYAANPQAWAFYPPNLLRAIVHTTPTPAGTERGLAVLAGLHLFALAVGSFLLARRHGLSRVASVLVFVAVAFNAAVLRRVVELHFIFTLAWLPWILLCVHRLVRSQTWRDKGLASVTAGALGGMALLGGFPQLYAYLAIAVASYAIAVTCARLPERGGRLSAFARDAAGAGVSGVLAACLAMCMLLPAVEYLGQSPRSAGSGVKVEGYAPEAWNVDYVIQSLVLYPGRTWEPETLRGAGVIVLCLALFGLFARPWRRALPLSLPLYALVDAMIGPPAPLSLFVELTTPFQLVSATRAYDVAVLFQALLAGAGLDHLLRLRSMAPRLSVSMPAWRRHAAGVAFVLSVGAVLAVFFHKLPIVTLKHNDLVWAFPLLFCAVGLGLLVWRPARRVRHRAGVVMGALVVAMVAGEIVAWCADYTPRLVVRRGHHRAWTDRFGYSGEEPLWPDNHRRTTEVQNYHLYGLEGVMNGYDPFHLHMTKRVLGQPGKTHKYRRSLKETELPQRNVFGHLFAKRALWLVPRVSTAKMPLDGTPFPPTTTAFVTAGQVPRGFPSVGEPVAPRWLSDDVEREPLRVRRARRLTRKGKRLRRFRFKRLRNEGRRHAAVVLRYQSQGRATLYGYAFRRPTDQRRERDLLFRTRALATETPGELTIALPDFSEFDLRLDVELAKGGSFELLAAELAFDRADEGRLIHLEERTADQVVASVGPLPGPRLLAFIDAAFPGWQVRVDDKPATLVRVNRGFKGVFLPEGTSRVRFEFRSQTIRIGVAISLVTLLLVLGLWLVLLRRPRQRSH